MCASLQTSGAGEIVWQAFVITSAIFVGLTLFTLVSKADFSWLGAVVFAGLIGLIAWGLITWVSKEESVDGLSFCFVDACYAKSKGGEANPA